MCNGKETHEHFSLLSRTYLEHKHDHDKRDNDFDNLHHHPPVDHHICSADELNNERRDTKRGLDANKR